jgi:hypothetical protein
MYPIGRFVVVIPVLRRCRLARSAAGFAVVRVAWCDQGRRRFGLGWIEAASRGSRAERVQKKV